MSNINTNNSLTDIVNSGGKFNSLLTDNDLNNTTDTVEKIKKLNEENKKLNEEYIKADPFRKNGIETRISLNNKEINDIQNSLTEGNQSLFDNKALLDYGRSVSPSGFYDKKWKEYNKDKNNVFITNNDNSINKPAQTDLSLNEDTGLDIQGLITWSEKYPALQLRLQDFVYCKRLGYYPNNRLIVLRRFKGAVPDNLYDYHTPSTSLEYTQPLATMITWLKPDDDIFDLEFHENWKEYSSGILETIKTMLNSKSNDGSSSLLDGIASNASDIITSLALENLGVKDNNYLKEDGTGFVNSPQGKPNLIKKAQKREVGGTGLSSKINFNITFEYELRDIVGIDSNIVMLDLMSNAMRMGTSESEFLYNMPIIKDSSLKRLVNGDIISASKDFITDITKFAENVSKVVVDGLKGGIKIASDLLTTGKSDTGSDIVNKSTIYIFSKYRESLKASLSVDSGMESGIWHVTIGNPKSPIISCGDLIINSSKLELGSEFGFNDFPNSFKVSYTISSARERGRQEIARIFNSGKGRLYVYPNAKDNPDYNMY